MVGYLAELRVQHGAVDEVPEGRVFPFRLRDRGVDDVEADLRLAPVLGGPDVVDRRRAGHNLSALGDVF